jgi:DNA-binding response OmpR family regulator
LIVEGDVHLGKLLAREFERKELQVQLRTDATSIAEYLQESKWDLIIVDLSLSTHNGMEPLNHIRAASRDLPVLVLSGSKAADDLEQAFDHGADDFLSKPFSLRELVARARRLLRRKGLWKAKPSQSSSLTLNREGYAVFRGDQQIDLTPKEFAILEYMMNHSGKVVSRQSLLQDIWNMPASSSTNVVDVYMKYLRDKIDAGQENKIIRTVRGIGYVLKGGECQYA